MDWQHLLMNGEHLPEYAALLAAEGLLGHQHANSGWGTFDDDNMVGATAFMETVELALELRRADYGANGERLGFDLYPYTEDQVAAVQALGQQWRFIDEVAPRIDGDALREAQQRKDAVAAYELVYAALGARTGARMTRLRRARRRHVVGQGDRDRRGRRGAGRRRARLPAVDAAARLERAGPRGLVARRGRGARASSTPSSAAGIGLSGQMHGLVALDAADRPLRPAILWNDGRTQAQCDEIEERIGLERLVAADRQPRAGRASPRPSCCGCAEHEPEVYGRIAHILLPKDYVRLQADRRARDRRRRRLGHAALRRRRARLERRGRPARSTSTRRGCRRSTSRPPSPA